MATKNGENSPRCPESPASGPAFHVASEWWSTHENFPCPNYYRCLTSLLELLPALLKQPALSFFRKPLHPTSLGMELGRGHSVTQSFDERTAGGMKFAGSSYNNTSSTIDGLRNSSTGTWCRDHDENRRGPHERDSAHHQLSSTLGQPLNRYSISQGTHQQQQQQQQQQSQQHPHPHQQQLPPRPRNPGSQHYADVSVYYPRGNRNKPVKWSPEEDRKLREAVEKVLTNIYSAVVFF